MPIARICSLVALLALSLSASALSLDLGTQRIMFEQAEKLAENPENPAFRIIADQLKNYPLYPYLEFKSLSARLSRLENQHIDQFLQRYPNSLLADQLRKLWLTQLAASARWTDFIRYYQAEDSVTMKCHFGSALLATGKDAEGQAVAEELWLHGESRPDACEPLFKKWKASGNLNRELVWQRIALAMDKDNSGLAKSLEAYLSAEDRTWLDRWIAIQNKPENARALLAKESGQHAYKANILGDAAIRLTRKDLAVGIKLWADTQASLNPSNVLMDKINRSMVLVLLREPSPDAWQFIQSVKPNGLDNDLHAQRIRAALYRQQWQTALEWIALLPEADRQNERWRYWQARALASIGKDAEANEIFSSLATNRSYYGFLAADLKNADYHLAHVAVPVNSETQRKLDSHPAIQRSGELLALGRTTQARREWQHAQKTMSETELMAAANLAKLWGWTDQAIFTLAKTNYWDDLEIRFPLEHKGGVEDLAQTEGLSPSWVFGVIRQESAFNANVVSPAGAVGLMQLMPATAKLVAKKLKQSAPDKSALTNPSLNIRLGVSYLKQVLEQLGGNPVLATAAYNAGPHRVQRWIPEQDLPADIWVELIPFAETRTYVQRVFTYASIYDYRLNRPALRISARMQEIKGKKSSSGT